MATNIEISTILNIFATIGSVGWATYLFRKWMLQRESAEQEIKRDALRASEKVALEFAERHRASCEEIKAKISDNREYYKSTYDDLSADNKEIIRLQRITNGRVNQLETDLAVLKQAHADRTGRHERKEDCC
jgi:hypothetical protein